MPPRKPLLILSILLTIIHSITAQTFPENDPFVNYCSGDNYTSPSPYAANLRLLLANLTAATPNSPSYFSLANATSPQIFGLAQCRPDLTPSVCAACLNQCAVAFTNNPGCVRKKSFANRARNCLLRYSDQPFYNTAEENLYVYFPNRQNSSDSFNRQASMLMERVIGSASAAASRFAVGATNDSVAGGGEIYGMGWCSRDLASGDCAECLGRVWGRIAGKGWGDGAYVSCEVRYETDQFYASFAVAPAPAPAPASREPAVEGGGEWFV